MQTDNIFLSVGSNLGDRYETIHQARDRIASAAGNVIESSSIYETEPWGNRDQNYFLNQVLLIHSSYNPAQLLQILNRIEKESGRVRKEINEPRILDLDILLFGNHIANNEKLKIPHPRMHLRKFILIPMNEIAAELIHPVLKLSMKELLKRCTDSSSVIKYRQHEIKSK